jgi:hypothetical protein
MNYKKIAIALLILLGLAGLVWLVWYFVTHSKTLKVVSVDKTGRVIKTLSPLGAVNFQVPNGGNISDNTVKKNSKYELLYRSNDEGETIDVVLTTLAGGIPEYATVNFNTGKVTYHPAVLMTQQK